MKIALDSGGSYLEPDDGPRNTRWHKRIVRTEPIPNTQTGNNLTLECGHGVQSFGNLLHAQGVVFCTKCRDLEEDSVDIKPAPRQTAVLTYVVYDHPRDSPGEFVCRRWQLDQLVDTGEPFAHAKTLEEIRRALPPKLVKIMPWGQDDPVILEMWV